jgi:hypothetical protein
VYKFFNVTRAITFRTTAFLNLDGNGAPSLAVRFYNSTPFALADVHTELTVRCYEVDPLTGSLDVYNLFLFNKPWIYGPPGVPFTIDAPLEATDVLTDAQGVKYWDSHANHKLRGDNWDLITIVSGKAPNLNADFTISRVFRPEEITKTTPRQISLQRTGDARTWQGWGGFDEPS